VGGALYVMELIGGAEEVSAARCTIEQVHIHPENGNCSVCRNVGQLAIFNTVYTRKPKSWLLHHHIQHTAHFLPCVRRPKTTNRYIFTQRMAAAVFAETLHDSQYGISLYLKT
jgi:hypothetical protein